jgi:cell division ATPase FtsA
MPDLTKRLLAMPQVLKVGIENLNYDIRYDSDAKQIQVTYEFTCGIPHISGTTTVDYEIPNEDQAARLTRRALRVFSARLGDTIERAIRQLMYQALFEAGVDLTDSRTEMAGAMSADFRRELAPELEVRRGRPKGKGSVDQATVAKFKKDVHTVLTKLRREGSKPIKSAVAKRLYDRHANPIREFNRRLKAYNLTFEELRD